jgi:hypothetical protein
MFVGSGCAALIYEVVWFQLLELVSGSSTVSMESYSELHGLGCASAAYFSHGSSPEIFIRFAFTRSWNWV